MNPIRSSLPILAVLAAAPHAPASSLLHVLTGPTGEAPRTVVLSVPRFEPTLGRLDEVHFRLHIQAQGGIGVENLATSTVSATATRGVGHLRRRHQPSRPHTARAQDISWQWLP